MQFMVGIYEFPGERPTTPYRSRVLRDNGFATVRAEGSRRLYAVDSAPLQEVDVWLDRFRRFWNQHLDALATELARGRRERRTSDQSTRRPNDRHPQPAQRRAPGNGSAGRGTHKFYVP
jgi:hypothetical protein